MLLPVAPCPAGRRQACIACSQLVAVRTLRCSCVICSLWCLGYVHVTKKKLKKKLEKSWEKKQLDMNSARLELTQSNPKSGIVKFLFFAAHARRTAHTCPAQQKREREAVMTDVGSQPSIEQLATAVHIRPAARSWCGPLLLVLLGGVVMLLVFSACCLMSRSLG